MYIFTLLFTVVLTVLKCKYHCIILDYYDETDAVAERATVSVAADADVELLTQTDNPEREPSYADFLIAYSTQSCTLNIVTDLTPKVQGVAVN